MTYDDNARRLAIKVIAKVESNNDYSAINYNDPITVGVVQWFGNRAAAILLRMKRENSGAWNGVSQSLDNHLATIDPSNSFWNSRYLSTTEGSSLIPVLTANKSIQDSQIVADCEVYKNQAIQWGLDVDVYTDTTVFFFTMYHQSPQASLDVLLANGSDDSLSNTLANCLAHPVLGQYANRYNEAHDMILAGDAGTDPLPEPPGDEVPVLPSDPGANPEANLSYLEAVGNFVRIHYFSGETIDAYPDGKGRFLPRGRSKTQPPVVIPPDPDPDPDPPAGGAWVHPLPGSIITSPYGPRSLDGFHYGVDLSTPGNAGTLRAVTKMVITVAKNVGDPGAEPSAGSYVKGHSVDGLHTFSYAHMVSGSLRVSAGQTVEANTVIGVEGATGNAFGRHCHFEYYPGNKFDPWWTSGGHADPVAFLRSKSVTI